MDSLRKRRNKSKIWTPLGKEEQVKDMNPPRTKGEHVDNMDPPRKRVVIMIDINDGMLVMLQHERGQMRLKMLRRSDIHLWTIVSFLEDCRYNTLFMRAVLNS